MSSLSTFIQILKWADWDSPPAQMNCEMPFGEILQTIAQLLSVLDAAPDRIERLPIDQAKDLLDSAIRLYILAPSIVNVLLNYKICIEHGLPLHPTVYYELKEARKYRIGHSLGEIQKANELFWKSIDVARACCRLDHQASQTLAKFASELPFSVHSFIYTAVQDKYTWIGSEPSLLLALANKIRKTYAPQLVVAAAHGSIMPALVLAELLQVPLYFIRFSMFKRHDEEPIVSLADQAWLFDFRDKEVILYDEDVAGGRTLESFLKRLSPLFRNVKTACSIRHAGSSIQPDFCGKIWWD